jgi:hypothetical protein
MALRVMILLSLVALGLAALLLLDPIPQDPGYHAFADTRALLAIPNFADVVSNAGFLLVGGLGLAALWRGRRTLFDRPGDARPYLVFLLGVALVGVGSAYYHWDPTTARLLWDRLPMSVAFMALCAAVVADRIDVPAGNGWLLLLLVAIGLASLVWWSWTESQGRGDLRLYGFVQFFPVVLLPVLCWLFPDHRYLAGRALAWVIVWYGLSKVLEHFDHQIFAALDGTVSGHTLKHLAAAVATYVVLHALLSRRRTA